MAFAPAAVSVEVGGHYHANVLRTFSAAADSGSRSDTVPAKRRLPSLIMSMWATTNCNAQMHTKGLTGSKCRCAASRHATAFLPDCHDAAIALPATFRPGSASYPLLPDRSTSSP